jgi:hypothetical protein
VNDTTRDDLYVFEVYGDPGVVKIGRSLNVPRRFISIQCSCPYELWLRARIFGGGGLEPFLHEMFARSRMRGEWFRLDEHAPRPSRFLHFCRQRRAVRAIHPFRAGTRGFRRSRPPGRPLDLTPCSTL